MTGYQPLAIKPLDPNDLSALSVGLRRLPDHFVDPDAVYQYQYAKPNTAAWMKNVAEMRMFTHESRNVAFVFRVGRVGVYVSLHSNERFLGNCDYFNWGIGGFTELTKQLRWVGGHSDVSFCAAVHRVEAALKLVVTMDRV